MSSDPEHGVHADGITENLITEVSSQDTLVMPAYCLCVKAELMTSANWPGVGSSIPRASDGQLDPYPAALK
jgi:TolB-like protein